MLGEFFTKKKHFKQLVVLLVVSLALILLGTWFLSA